jgi:hypothetical protein
MLKLNHQKAENAPLPVETGHLAVSFFVSASWRKRYKAE